LNSLPEDIKVKVSILGYAADKEKYRGEVAAMAALWETYIWTACLFLVLTTAAFCHAVTIVVPKAQKNDAGYTLACEHMVSTLESKQYDVLVTWCLPKAPLPSGDVILVGHLQQIPGAAWLPAKPEGFRIMPVSLPGRRALLVEGDERGTMYGLFKLAERIRLGDDLWQIKMELAPAFPQRIYSELGQLLDIPDIGYYSDKPPYVNEKIMRQEVNEAKELLRHIVSLGYNTLAILHLGVEEYIDYRYLDKQVYTPDDRHRTRSTVFCKYFKDLCDYAHSLHVDVYLQVYEIQYPPKLDELYGVDLDSPKIERIINARYKELFERVPLDGMIIGATETHPRAVYHSKQLWRKKGKAGAGRMLTMYHNACKAAGKKSIFRLWRIADDVDGMKKVARYVPKDAVMMIKNTGGDFWLNYPTTTVVTQAHVHKQPLVVVFDTFRQYDGWSRLFCYMKRWGEVVKTCRDNGVVGLNAWGAWSPGCLWPDYEPGYLRGSSKPVSWRGYWNNFRMFSRGFTPGQANVYLLGRLGWNPDADIKQIAQDFAALHVGTDNASAAAEALLATEDAFAEEYIGKRSEVTHPCYIKWTMTFAPRYKQLEQAYQRTSRHKLLASNALALKQVAKMEKAFAQTDPSKSPDAKKYAKFKEGIDKTALYLQTFYLWRECWWRNRAARDLNGKEKSANAAALHEAKAQLMPLFDQWQRYPEEAGFWRVTFRYGRPNISKREVFPSWYPRGSSTMETTAKSFGRQ